MTPSDVLKWKAAGDLTTQKGGAGSNNPTAKTERQGHQGAYETSISPLISRVSKSANFAGCQQRVLAWSSMSIYLFD